MTSRCGTGSMGPGATCNTSLTPAVTAGIPKSRSMPTIELGSCGRNRSKAIGDIYARRFDAASQSWGALQRLTDHPLPDINPRVGSDGNGRIAVVWQGFRNGASNIYLRMIDGAESSRYGEDWSPVVAVTDREASEWGPRRRDRLVGYGVGRIRHLQERQLRRLPEGGPAMAWLWGQRLQSRNPRGSKPAPRLPSIGWAGFGWRMSQAGPDGEKTPATRSASVSQAWNSAGLANPASVVT